MIARISVPVIIALLLSAFYFDRQHLRRHRWSLRILFWGLIAAALAFTVCLACEQDYFPDNMFLQDAYLAMLCIGVLPLAVMSLFGSLGWLFGRRDAAERVGCGVSLLCVLAYIYGSTIGFNQLEVKRVELSFDDLPAEFDGYKMVLFSDAHLGTYVGWRRDILRRAVDSINAQRADMVVFTGDLQNKRVEEIEPHKQLLSGIAANDGVFSVLGNHDYCEYIGSKDPYVLSRQMGLMLTLQQEMGWTVLCNSRRRLHRDSATLVIAGMENDGEGRFPQLGNISSTLMGVNRKEFVIMLEHDPTSWERKILPHCHAQLTLSGHTHGGQLSLLGWSPASLRYRFYEGLYRVGNRMLYVTKGLGGAVAFRLGAPGEIVVIILKRNKA